MRQQTFAAGPVLPQLRAAGLQDSVSALGTAAWVLGVLLWVVTGVATAVATQENWSGVTAGAGMLFSMLFLIGLIAVGVRTSAP